MPQDRDHWTRVADEWIAWARTPGHDAFWAYRAALAHFVGPGDGFALDVGCGEGRISRLLRELGWDVVATDAVEPLVRAAADARSASAHAVAAADALPFTDGRFDLVMAYNMLMDVEDLPGTMREIARVLRPGGQLVLSIVHPFRDRGTVEGTGPDAPFVLRGRYFGRQRFEGVEERRGLRMHFAGWSQPLEAYAAAIEAAGLAVTSMREPVPAPFDDPSRPDAFSSWRRVPLFLWMKARPLPP